MLEKQNTKKTDEDDSNQTIGTNLLSVVKIWI